MMTVNDFVNQKYYGDYERFYDNFNFQNADIKYNEDLFRIAKIDNKYTALKMYATETSGERQKAKEPEPCKCERFHKPTDKFKRNYKDKALTREDNDLIDKLLRKEAH
jgi:hypothetical protein